MYTHLTQFKLLFHNMVLMLAMIKLHDIDKKLNLLERKFKS